MYTITPSLRCIERGMMYWCMSYIRRLICGALNRIDSEVAVLDDSGRGSNILGLVCFDGKHFNGKSQFWNSSFPLFSNKKSYREDWRGEHGWEERKIKVRRREENVVALHFKRKMFSITESVILHYWEIVFHPFTIQTKENGSGRVSNWAWMGGEKKKGTEERGKCGSPSFQKENVFQHWETIFHPLRFKQRKMKTIFMENHFHGKPFLTYPVKHSLSERLARFDDVR